MNSGSLEMSFVAPDPIGWIQWPGYEDYSAKFVRILGATHEAGSSVLECFHIARQITPGDDESWYREWKKLADAYKSRGDRALVEGYFGTAQSSWLKALSYLRSAECVLDGHDARSGNISDEMETCAHLYLQYMRPQGEIVEIPCEDGDSLAGYFLRAPNAPPKSPVVICLGAEDECKEDHLYRISRHGLNRGLSLFLIDLPGQGASARKKLAARHDAEVPIGRCVDYLQSRDDVDAGRIAVYGGGLGGASAAQAASRDRRIAAVVCDGGFWEQYEQTFLLGWSSSIDEINRIQERARKLRLENVALQIKCPCLVMVSEHDSLRLSEAVDLYNFSKDAGVDIELKIFPEDFAGDANIQFEKENLGREFIFDWIAKKIA